MDTAVKRCFSACLVLLCCSAAAAQSTGSASSFAQVASASNLTAATAVTQYSMTTIPLDTANAINDAGEIVGSVGGDAAVFHNGVVKLLQGRQGYTNVKAVDISNTGHIVGYANAENSVRGLYWSDENSAPIVLGACMVHGQEVGDCLGPVYPTAVNSQGVVVGYYGDSGAEVPFRWVSGYGIRSILPYGVSWDKPQDISDTGYVTGTGHYTNLGDAAIRWYPNGNAGRINDPAYGYRVYDDGSVLGARVVGASLVATLWNIKNTPSNAGPAPSTHHVSDKNSSGRFVGSTRDTALPWTSVDAGPAVYLPIPSGALGGTKDVNRCGTILGSITVGHYQTQRVYWSKLTCDEKLSVAAW